MTRSYPSAAACGLTLRARTDADLPFVAALYASTRTEELAATGWPEAARVAFLAQQHEAQHAHYTAHYAGMEALILEYAGRAIGRLYLLDRPAETRIVDIALMPEVRGRGFGTALLTDLIAEAERTGRTLSIHVEQTNRARTLYQRFGFRVQAAAGGIYDLWEWHPAIPEGQLKTAS